MKTEDFDPKRARAKRPLPIWVDALMRDAMSLSCENIGALTLLLMAMWGTKDCNFPDDPQRLATVTRVSLRKWKTKLGPALEPLFDIANGYWVSKRLQKEAAFVEDAVSKQSHRSRSKKNHNSLKTNNVTSSVDTPMDSSVGEPWGYPTQQPNNPSKEEESIASSSFPPKAYAQYLEAHPEPHDSKTGRRFFCNLINARVSEEEIIEAARNYAEQVKGWSQYAKVQRSDNFLDPERGKWREYTTAKPSTRAEQIDPVRFWAERINAGKVIPSSAISSALGKQIVASGLVNEEGLKRANIRQ